MNRFHTLLWCFHCWPWTSKCRLSYQSQCWAFLIGRVYLLSTINFSSTFYVLLRKSRCPASIYLHKVNNRNNRTRCEICSKLTVKTPEQCHWRRSGVFTYFIPCFCVSIVNFEHVVAGWVCCFRSNVIFYQRKAHGKSNNSFISYFSVESYVDLIKAPTDSRKTWYGM